MMDVVIGKARATTRGPSLRRFLTIGPWVGMALLGALVVASLGTLRATRRHHQRIVLGMDLIADVYPPPGHLQEAFLNAFQIVDETDPAALRELLAAARRTGAVYKSHHNFWKRALPEGNLKTAMVERSYAPAADFLAVRDRDFIPLVLAGKRAEARRLLETVMRDSYEGHLRVIHEVVKTAFSQNIGIERQVTLEAKRLRAGTIVLGIFVGGTLIAGAVWASRRVRWRAFPTRAAATGARFTN